MIFNPTDRTRRVVAGVLAAGMLGGGAAGFAAATTAASAPASPRAAAPAAKPASTVPAPLTRAETAAEDVIGFLEQGKAAKSRAEARLLAELAHGKAGAALIAAGVPTAKVKAFQQRADRVAALSKTDAGALRVSLAANAVSELMPAFYARFTDPVPPTVLKLDHLDREIQLQSKARDVAKQRAAVGQLAATWKQLRPQLLAAGGGAVVKAYDAHVKAVKKPQSRAALQKEAVHGLDAVDQMEKVFLR
jgi:hypothetical protein